MSTDPTRRAHPITLEQAAADAPMLARLAALARDSNERLQAVSQLIPPALRGAIKAGPVDGVSWCLLVQGNAAAAKLRQLVPTLVAALRARGWQIDAIRIKVLIDAR